MPEFDVYCDENYPDLLTSAKPKVRFMLIGGLWVPTSLRSVFKEELHALRDKHKIGGEFKWQKVSPSKLHFYEDVIDWFFSKGDDVRFRCIAINAELVDLGYHCNDAELGFYKFYYQLLHHWISSNVDYNIFCDYKSTRVWSRLDTLKKCVERANELSRIKKIQSVRSTESVFIQLVDVLTGAASCRINNQVKSSGAKSSIVHRIENRKEDMFYSSE